jgi:hypothetical protein
MKKNILKYTYLLPLILIGIFFILQSIQFPIHDYGNYYYGAKILWCQDFDSQIYFPEWFNQKIVDISNQTYYLNYTPNTPFLALFYLPFSFLEIGLSKLIFNIITFILFCISIYRLFQFLKIDNRYLAFLPILFLLPIKNNILFGQTYFLILVLLIEAFIFTSKKKPYHAGFFISLAICLKVFPVFLIPYLILKKEWKTLISIVLFTMLFIGITLFFVPIETWEFYFETVLRKASNGEISGEIVSNYQSLQMFLKSGFTDYRSYLLGCKIALLGFAIFYTLKNKNNLYNYTTWLIISVAFSGYGSTYSLLLLVWFYVGICKSHVNLKWKLFWIIILFLIGNIPIHYFCYIAFPINFIRLLLMMILGVSLLFYFRKQIPFFLILLISGFISILHLFVFEKEKLGFEKAIPNESELLITDFQIINNQLVYSFWTENGLKTKSLFYKAHSIKPLKIQYNQIWFNQQKITNDFSNKKQAILVNNSYVLFLSDYDRGIGFYDIKKININ